MKEFDELVNIIIKHGEKHPKKHGNYIILRVDNNCFFQLDSWNKAIHLKQGAGERRWEPTLLFNDCGGFKGNDLMYAGSHWGSYDIRVPKNTIIALCNRIKNYLNSNLKTET